MREEGKAFCSQKFYLLAGAHFIKQEPSTSTNFDTPATPATHSAPQSGMSIRTGDLQSNIVSSAHSLPSLHGSRGTPRSTSSQVGEDRAAELVKVLTAF